MSNFFLDLRRQQIATTTMEINIRLPSAATDVTDATISSVFDEAPDTGLEVVNITINSGVDETAGSS